MYNEEEVFKLIDEFFDIDRDVDKAYKIHRNLLSYIPEDLREDSYFRYLEKGGTIGLNFNNYKIYEYPHKENESFRMIYPDHKIDELRELNYEPKVDFKFISIPCSLLEVELEDFNKFGEREFNNFREALILASQGKPNPKNIRNIDIAW